MVLTLRGSALLSRSSSALQKRGDSTSRPTATFSLAAPREAIVREEDASALIASFIEEDRQEAEAEPEADRANVDSATALKLRSAAKGAKQSVLNRHRNAEHAAQHALELSKSFGESANQVSSEALETGEVSAVAAVVAAGGQPIPGTRWVEYVDEEHYVGTPYYYNLDSGESVWTPPEEVVASQRHKSKRLLSGMGVESFSEKARDSLVASFIEEEHKEQELAARNARASATRKRRIAAREAEKQRIAAAEREAERDAMEKLLEAEAAARPPPAAPLASIIEASGAQNNALLQFARYLGMDPNEDQALLWIAKEAMLAPLPTGWSEVTDPTTGDVYYHCEATGESAWTHPSEAQYKELYKQIKHAQADRLQEVGAEGVRKTWGGDLIALHKHTHIKPMTGVEIRLARATKRGERRRREEECQARKARNRVRKERRIARVALRVQRIWRSKRFRRMIETKGLQRAAAITLQAAGRGLITRRRVCRRLRADLEREAATHIQRWARGYKLRRRMRGRMERLLFRRELRAKRREMTAARAANAAWFCKGGFRERIRCGEQGVLRKWDPPFEPLHVRAAAMRIQAAWRGRCGRAEAFEAFGQLQVAVAERLQQQAAALEIQRHWCMWRQQQNASSGVPYEATETQYGDETPAVDSSVDGRNSEGCSGRVEQSVWNADATCKAIAPGEVVCAAGDGHDEENNCGEWCETISDVSDRLQDNEEHLLPEAGLVCARLLQLKKMGVELLWLQPEAEAVAFDGTGVCTATKRKRKGGQRHRQQLRPCRVAETVAAAGHFFTRGETEIALRHLSSIHAAATRRTNEINQPSANVNDNAASEMQHMEYLSAVHCIDTAAAMAMPPVLGLREAADLTQRACGVLADQAMTANMTVRLAAQSNSVEGADLAAQKDAERRKGSDRELAAMASTALGRKSCGGTDLEQRRGTSAGKEHAEDDEDEENNDICLERLTAERKQLLRASQRRAASREAEVGVCEHNLALLQMLLGRPASEWQQTLTRAVTAVERADKMVKRSGAGPSVPAHPKIYISKVRKADSVLGRLARIAVSSAQVEPDSDTTIVNQGISSSLSQRPRTAPSDGRQATTWSSIPAFESSTRPNACRGDCTFSHTQNDWIADSRTKTKTSPFAVPAFALPVDNCSRTARPCTAAAAAGPACKCSSGECESYQSSINVGIGGKKSVVGMQRSPLCEVAANRSASAYTARKVRQAAEFAARDRRIAARAARPRTAPATRLLAKKTNVYGVEDLMPDKRQLAEIERLSPRGTTALFSAFCELRGKESSMLPHGNRHDGQREQHHYQPPPGADRYSWTCDRANDSRRQSGIFKAEMSVRQQTHRRRGGRRGAVLSFLPE